MNQVGNNPAADVSAPGVRGSGAIGLAIAAIVGKRFVNADDDVGERYRIDISRKYTSRPSFLIKPAKTVEAAEIVW